MTSTYPSSVTVHTPQFKTLSILAPAEDARRRRETQNKNAPKSMKTLNRPELLSTTHSDRVAILDKSTNTYCAYSLVESVEQRGLSLEEAEQWIEGQLLIKTNRKAMRILSVILIVTASWACAAISLWTLYKLIF